MRPALLLICIVYAGLGSDLRVGHNVVLSVPAGRSNWLLSSTRSEAELLFRKAASVREGSWRIKYAPGARAVIEELDDETVYVRLRDNEEAEGWVANGLVTVPPGEKKRLADETKAAADKRAAREKYMASLPRLKGAPEVIPVAADAGCYADLVKASALTGVELRKKFAELATFGCIFLVDGGTHVEAAKRADNSYAVVIREGKFTGKSGIVASAFLVK